MNNEVMSPESQPAPSVPPSARSVLVPAQRVMVFLAACMALQMTSFVIILPLFARRFSEFGAGVRDLGISDMAYALAATAAAPFMGALADRWGRRPVVLGSLVVYALAFTGYLFAFSASAFIVLRGLAGALTAGLMPAATGMVADVAPADRRAQWIGILSGGASIGWIAGPILGGVLYDRWGYATALVVGIGMAVAALAMALVGIPETRTRVLGKPVAPRSPARSFRPGGIKPALQAFRSSLPVALAPFLVLLLTYFGVMFAWAFIQPRFMFYAYEDLGWSSSMLGFMMSTYGAALMLGEFGLSRLSDRLGRKPVIMVGLVLFSAQFLGLALFRDYVWIAAAFVIAGLGNALYDPALSASILDITPSEHQARALGLKTTVGSIGSILGPALVVLFTPFLQAQGIFLVATGIVLLLFVIVSLAGARSRSGKEALRSNMADGGVS